MGFHSLGDLSEALTDLPAAHGWALSCIAKAAARRISSSEWLTPTKALCILLVPRPAAERRIHRDPGSAFWIKELNFRSLDDIEMAAMHEYRSGSTQNEHAQDPDYIGDLLVMYNIEGLGPMMSGAFPQFRPTAVDLPSPQEQGAIFEDLTSLCTGSINMRRPLRLLEGNDPLVPLPGRFYRVQKKWTWKPLFSDWKDYGGGDAALDEVLGGLELPDVTPPELMTALSRL